VTNFSVSTMLYTVDAVCLSCVLIDFVYYFDVLPSVLWHCWFGGRKGIRPVKTEWWGADVVICLDRGADLHTAQPMPLPLTVSCFSKIQIGFTFLVPAHTGSPGKGPLNGCVCVCVCVLIDFVYYFDVLPSVFWRYWLGGWKGIRPVKKLIGAVLAWLSVWSEVQTCIRPSWCPATHCLLLQ